jgi:SAM-dependent methyltransferase
MPCALPHPLPRLLPCSLPRLLPHWSRRARHHAPRLASAAAAALILHLATPAAAQDGDVPFVTTPDRVTLALLRLAGVGPGDHLVDLGSGDGRIVVTAALRHGARAVGVEIVPELVARSRQAAARAGVQGRTEFREQDLFATDLSPYSVVTLYLLPEVNLKLRPALLALAPGTRIVSHDWDMGDWPADETLTLEVPEKAIGREKRSRLHRWVVPARLQGIWCGSDGSQLQVTQQYQSVQLNWSRGARSIAMHGRLDGRRLRALGAGGQQADARVKDTVAQGLAGRQLVGRIGGRAVQLVHRGETPCAG